MCRAGGRRCPGANSPSHIALRNAKRRERYALSKMTASNPDASSLLKNTTLEENDLGSSDTGYSSSYYDPASELAAAVSDVVADADVNINNNYKPYLHAGINPVLEWKENGVDHTMRVTSVEGELVYGELLATDGNKIKNPKPYALTVYLLEDAVLDAEPAHFSEVDTSSTNYEEDLPHYKVKEIPEEAKEAVKLLQAVGGKNNDVTKNYDFSEWKFNGLSGDQLYDQGVVPAAYYPEHNVKIYENKGNLADSGYYAKRTLRGKINPEAIKEGDDVAIFGFPTIPEDKVYVLGDKNEVYAAGSTDSDDFYQLSSLEMKDIDDDSSKVVARYTRDLYQQLNRNLYKGPEELCRTGQGEVAKNVDEALEHFGEDSDNDNNPQNFKILYNSLQKAYDQSPKIPRYTMRAQDPSSSAITNAGGVDEYVEDNYSIGSIMKFDTFQSSSPKAKSVSDFLHDEGILFEVYTPEGLNVKSVSHYKNENELLLPSGQKYMTVGVHKGVTIDNMDMTWDNVTIIRQVAVNDQGEILDGTNADKQDKLEKQERWKDLF